MGNRTKVPVSTSYTMRLKLPSGVKGSSELSWVVGGVCCTMVPESPISLSGCRTAPWLGVSGLQGDKNPEAHWRESYFV